MRFASFAFLTVIYVFVFFPSLVDVVPYDPFNISIVASESPRNFKCHVNPDLSLSTTDPDSPSKTNHVNTMQIYKTFGQKGNDSGQLNSPHGFCLGLNEDIVVADTGNHRIQVKS